MSVNWLKGMDQHMEVHSYSDAVKATTCVYPKCARRPHSVDYALEGKEELLWLTLHTARRTWMA